MEKGAKFDATFCPFEDMPDEIVVRIYPVQEFSPAVFHGDVPGCRQSDVPGIPENPGLRSPLGVVFEGALENGQTVVRRSVIEE